jgi:hypothetical protein
MYSERESKEIKNIKLKHILFLHLFLTASLFLLTSISASYAAPYDLAAYDNSTLGKACYGVYGYNYVMKDHSLIPGQHVSSLYVWQHPDGYNLAEIGWVWRGYREDHPHFFGAYEIRGSYYSIIFSDAPKGTNHYYTVRNVSGSNNWRWYIDGVLKWEVNLGGWKQGYALAASERWDEKDSNYSHFWNLRKRDSSGNWYNWTNLQVYVDTDPDYWLNKVSNTECYMQHK